VTNHTRIQRLEFAKVNWLNIAFVMCCC